MPTTGTIAIRNLEFQGRHGATAAERKTLRRFQVDLDIHIDLTRAIAGDRLADTADYHAVCALIVEIGTSRTFHLIEALRPEHHGAAHRQPSRDHPHDRLAALLRHRALGHEHGRWGRRRLCP